MPILPDGKILLERQYRVTLDEYIIELPAGTRESDEEPVVTARRELTEETGYVAGSMEQMMRFFPSPGIMREEMFLFLARDLVPGETEKEDGEDIELLSLELEQALDMIRTGEIKDAKTIIGLLYFARKCEV